MIVIFTPIKLKQVHNKQINERLNSLFYCSPEIKHYYDDHFKGFHSSLIPTGSVLRYITLSDPGSMFHIAQLMANRERAIGTNVANMMRKMAEKFSERSSTTPLTVPYCVPLSLEAESS